MEVEKKQSSNWVRGKLIGRGSYGSVCIGIRESDGGRFAVKSADKNSPSSMEALQNEIEILRFLSSSSPFIVECYGDDETGNLHLEYLPGSDVAKSGGIGVGIDDVELIRSYAWCLVMALKEVHSKGVVHCDVKGGNVLVGSTKGVVKLSDFGSAKKLDDHHDQKIVPRGSPLWMAPEVVRGESQGCESDIWSLGCTVLEMFTGVPAWKDCGVAHTLFQIGYSDDLPEYPPHLPELAKDFLNKCLIRNPEQRWSCDQLLQHPFLLPVPASMIAESSPRSIFDWQNLDFSDDEEESSPSPSPSSSSSCYDVVDEISVRDRIGELATMSGANWESDGWVEVRNLRKEKEEVSEGTSWEYSDSEEENVLSGGVNWETHDDDYPTWFNLSCDNDNGEDDEESSISGVDGGDRCGHGDSYGNYGS
ncbi:hypothetical protein SOVF_026890 [Spinacia oleracea]|nr:hypothetical protein SOVF_026890 [Spinacia oleracea]